MRLIEIVSQFKPGMRVRHEGNPCLNGGTFSSLEDVAHFFAGRSQIELLSEGWSILPPEDFFCKSHTGPESCGYQSRCVTIPVIVSVEHKKPPFRSEHLLSVMRRELNIPDRHDVIVRELWLAMQLLATPESCADFMRRSLVVG